MINWLFQVKQLTVQNKNNDTMENKKGVQSIEFKFKSVSREADFSNKDGKTPQRNMAEV